MDERSRRVCSSLKKIGIPSLDEMKAPFFAKKKKKERLQSRRNTEDRI